MKKTNDKSVSKRGKRPAGAAPGDQAALPPPPTDNPLPAGGIVETATYTPPLTNDSSVIDPVATPMSVLSALDRLRARLRGVR